MPEFAKGQTVEYGPRILGGAWRLGVFDDEDRLRWYILVPAGDGRPAARLSFDKISTILKPPAPV